MADAEKLISVNCERLDEILPGPETFMAMYQMVTDPVGLLKSNLDKYMTRLLADVAIEQPGSSEYDYMMIEM